MGSVVAAPLSAAATFLGGCCGTFAAGCCYRLAGSGQVGSAQAVRSVIVLLQAFTAALATVASATPTLWLPWACGRLRAVGAGDLGICGCSGDEACWADQLVYRAEAAGVAVFLALLLMAAGGCAEGASRSAAVAKFMAVPLIGFVLLFVGNDVLSTFGAFATVASAVFLAVQAVMLIDFAYAWNEDWYAKALEARRGARASSGFQGWQMGILVASALLLLGSIAGTICLLIAVPDARARSVTAVAWVLAAVLLVVSITEHVKHGALLTSCVVMAYNAWLTWEAMSLLPGGRGPELPAWASLSVCAVSLLLFSRRAGGADAAADQDGPDPAAGACGEAGSSFMFMSLFVPRSSSSSALGAADARDFRLQCAVHAAAGVYLTAALAPRAGDLAHGVHTAVVFGSLALYGWSLMAPYVLRGRSFG
ncbi:unnamed protein product [Prorocentrum cordatum]|uniref:Uncharacterized protein n=2 Tax=Prorocentrum cordatum TaxID=2364126 RepID=A0ABN9WE87_9DINO|nr:unnamed protein product [Polarella glacialis]